MSFSMNNPLILGDINAPIKKEIGNLEDLDTTDKSSLVNALNEAIDNTLNGASRSLDNLSDTGNSRLHALKAYADEGELLTDADGLAFVEKYAHSTFDRSKFTVVGSPNITDDGIASGFSGGNCLTIPSITITKNTSATIKIRHTLASPVSDNDWLFKMGFYANNPSAINFFVLQSTLQARMIVANTNADTPIDAPLTAGKTYDFCLIVKDGAVKLEVTDIETNITISSTSIVLANDFSCIETPTIGLSSGTFHCYGSIDLKQFSITVDGVEVFSGNKTGIDTIKPDDYTVVGTPTISADGIASGFSASNYIKSSILNAPTKSLRVKFKININSSPTATNGICGDTSVNTGFYFDISAISTFKWTLSKNTVGDIINNKTVPNLTLTNGEYLIELTWNGSVYKLLINGSEVDSIASSEAISLISSNFIIGNRGNLSVPFTIGSIDLNSLKIYVDGNLVYQPCLKIPYTEAGNGKGYNASTGSKVVNAIYRDRVNDMADQFGYANYYTLQEDKKGNYTVVGSPTISSDFVASGLTTSNYIVAGITLGELKNKSWEIETPIFTYNNIDAYSHLLSFNGVNACLAYSFTLKNTQFIGRFGDNTTVSTVITKSVDITQHSTLQLKLNFNISTGLYSLYGKVDGGAYELFGTYTPTTTDKQLYDIINNTTTKPTIASSVAGNVFLTDLKEFKIYVDNELAYEAVTDPNFTLPQVELYGLIGQRTLRDSYRNGINYWELYSNRDLEQGGSCTSGVEVTFARPFADTNYVLSVPYSAKSATAFTPTQTGDWIAKGKGVL